MVASDELEARAREIRAWYDGYSYKCRLFQDRFADHLARALRNAGLLDAKLEARTKSTESVVAKAVKLTPSGQFKYEDPRTEITDLVGTRIQVPLSTDLPGVVTLLRQTYVIVEELERGGEEGTVDIPGYRSLHFLVRLGEQDRQDFDFREFGDMVVEVQVRTTLQHAWASLQHDLMYKTERAPTPAIRRRLIALAGLLELADREFVSVRQAHSEVRDSPDLSENRPVGELTASGIRHLAEQMFEEEDISSQDWYVTLRDILAELGLTRGEQLTDALGDWTDKATEVAVAVRVTKPWVNTAYLFDMLLRLALRERYFELHRPFSPEDPVEPEELEALKADFLEELSQVEKGLGAQ